MKIDSPKRTLAKTLSWRFLSVIITFVVAYTITRNTSFAASISVADTVIKMTIYYLHERAWVDIKWGRKKVKKNKKKKKKKLAAVSADEGL